MGKRHEISGQRFGRLLVISKAPVTQGKNPLTQWNCVCDCGEARIVGTMNLVRGRAKSCGCLHKEIVSKNSRTHGLRDSGAYKSWNAMWRRCKNKTNASYANYGGRGIGICDRWKSFEDFYADMGERPEGMSLDRFPNSNGNYEPGNCRWATKEEQDNNKRTNVYVTWNGKTQTHAQWARELNSVSNTLRSRYLKFGTFERQPRTYNLKEKKMDAPVKSLPSIAMDEVASSRIFGIGHDAPTNTLAIRFRTKDGSPAALYHYENVTAEEFEAFKGAESIGSHFYKNIKPFDERYPFVCIEKKPAAQQEQT